MIFKDYRDIVQNALDANHNDAYSACAAIGIDQITFYRILAGANLDLRTTHRLLVYLSRHCDARSEN